MNATKEQAKQVIPQSLYSWATEKNIGADEWERRKRVVNVVENHQRLVEALKHFTEWHANHFDDFSHEINSQLLCLANEVEAALEAVEEEEQRDGNHHGEG